MLSNTNNQFSDYLDTSWVLHVTSVLTLPGLSTDPSQVEHSVPQDCPSLQMPVVSHRTQEGILLNSSGLFLWNSQIEGIHTLSRQVTLPALCCVHQPKSSESLCSQVFMELSLRPFPSWEVSWNFCSHPFLTWSF